MATREPGRDFRLGEHAGGDVGRNSRKEWLALGPPLPKKPYLSDVELRRDGDGRPVAILEKFKVTFGNRLTETPLDARRRKIDWENEIFPPKGEAWLHKTIQWARIGEACPMPKFEWRQQREHTDMVPVSPRAERLQYAIIKGTGHLRMEGTEVRTSIHVREAIGNRVSPWSNAIWFDVNAEGRLIDYGTTEVRLREENGDRETRSKVTLAERCEALGFTRGEAQKLADLIASHNRPTDEDPIGRVAWDWIREQLGRGHRGAANITKAVRTLNGLIIAARRFWGLLTGE